MIDSGCVRNGRFFTRKEDQLVLSCVGKNASHRRDVAQQLGRTVSAIDTRLHRLRARGEGAAVWTTEEDHLILTHHKPMRSDWDEVAALFPHRTVNAIRQRCRDLNDKKNYSRPAPVTRKGRLRCLCCGSEFESWDVRRNRMCVGCR